MKCVPTAIAFSCALIWLSAANAACVTERQCDNAGNCTQVKTCDGVHDIVQSAMDSTATVTEATGPLAAAPVAAAVAATNSNCREVEICGTTQLVCD